MGFGKHQFFLHAPPPPLEAVIFFLDDPPPQKKKSSLSDSTNQKKEKSISDLLVIVRPERVAFGLSLASSSSESQINARMTSLESFPPESMTSLSCSSYSLSSVPLLSAIALLSVCVNVLAFLRVSWPAIRGLVCCKQCLTITLIFSLLLLFKCCFRPWWFKYLFSSGTRSFLSLAASSHSSVST